MLARIRFVYIHIETSPNAYQIKQTVIIIYSRLQNRRIVINRNSLLDLAYYTV